MLNRLRAGNPSPISRDFTGTLTGKKEFRDLTIEGDWHTDSLELGGTFNEMDVNSWPSDTIMKKSKPLLTVMMIILTYSIILGKDQVIKSKKSLKSITVDNIHVSSVDDANINELLNVILVDQPAKIDSDVIFQGQVSTSTLIVNGKL